MTDDEIGELVVMYMSAAESRRGFIACGYGLALAIQRKTAQECAEICDEDFGLIPDELGGAGDRIRKRFGL